MLMDPGRRVFPRFFHFTCAFLFLISFFCLLAASFFLSSILCLPFFVACVKTRSIGKKLCFLFSVFHSSTRCMYNLPFCQPFTLCLIHCVGAQQPLQVRHTHGVSLLSKTSQSHPLTQSIGPQLRQLHLHPRMCWNTIRHT